LVPEVPIVLEDALPHLERVVDKKGHAVVVVAEGAGEELLGASAEKDAGGNKKLPPIGAWLTKQIKAYFKGADAVSVNRSEFTRNRKRNHPLHCEMDTSRVDGVKPSLKRAGTNREVTVKYIDPSYMVRSVPADAGDSYLCMLLAHAAAHGAMAGYTGFTVGLVKNKSVMIPIPELARSVTQRLFPSIS